jgi:hypothetical protein
VIRHGIWGQDAEDASSNYRELRNLVEHVELGARNEGLHGTELFLYTDNSTAEAAFFKGSSSNKLLDELVVRLKKVESDEGMRIHFLHIAGTRMIELGIDGLSRGSLMEGVMKDPGVLASVPFHLSAFERATDSALLHWFQGWMGLDQDNKPLQPEEWFVEGQGLEGEGNDTGLVWMPRESTRHSFLWAPPPAAADVAIEELRRSRHKRPHLFHVFACPRLMTPRWRRSLCREANFLFEIPAGSKLWPASSHEPLLVGVFLPFIRHRPWQLRHSPKLLGMERKLRSMWKTGEGNPGTLLRELRLLPRKLDTMSEGMVRKVLRTASR